MAIGPPVRVGDFEFHPDSGELRRGEAVIRLQPQCAALLSEFVRRAGTVVTRDDLRQSLWPRDTFVEFEDGLNHAVARLREAFDDSARQPRYVETLPRRGYRLIAPVERTAPPNPPAPVERLGPVEPAAPAALPQPTGTAPPADRRSRTVRLGLATTVLAGVAIAAGAGWMWTTGRSAAGNGRAPDAQAYELFLKGNVQIERYGDQVAVNRAMEYYQAAAARDPEFAGAQAGIATSYMQKMMYESQPTKYLREAAEAANRATTLDPDLADAHLIVGRLRSWFQWDWRGAEQAFRRGIALHPTSTFTRNYYSAFLMSTGRYDEATAFTTATLALAPHSLSALAILAEAQMAAGRFDEVIATANRALSIDPTYSVMHRYLATAYLQSDPARAIEESRKILVPDAINVLAVRAAIAGCAGARAEALTLKAQLNQVMADQYVRPTRMAQVESCLGDWDAAFTWLEKGVRGHELEMAMVRTFVMLRPLMNDPRFQEILRRVHLPPETPR